MLPPPPRSPLFPYTTLFRSIFRPSNSRPLSWEIAFCASSAVAISTNPKPRDCPEKRSVITVADRTFPDWRSEEHTSELQSLTNLVCRLLLEKKKKNHTTKNR